jgi:hypothetical protein
MNRIDICEAYYMFAADYHVSGLTRRCMSRRTIMGQLHRMGFRPSPMLSYETLTEEAQMLYNDLAQKWEPESWAANQEG